jgi:hypothetical protein
VGSVEIVVANVGKTKVVTYFGIEVVVLDATAYLDTSVEAFEADVVEGTVGMAIAEVLGIPSPMLITKKWADTLVSPPFYDLMI